MNIGTTLNPEEFSMLHNALCDLRSTRDQLSEVVNPKLVERLSLSIKSIEESLKSSYRREEELVDNRSSYYEHLSDVNNFASRWSILEVADMYSEHPYQGVKELVYVTMSSHTRWMQSEVRVPVNGNTWMDLWKAADAAIRQSGDDHHIFIEGFSQDLEEVHLSTGS